MNTNDIIEFYELGRPFALWDNVLKEESRSERRKRNRKLIKSLPILLYKQYAYSTSVKDQIFFHMMSA